MRPRAKNIPWRNCLPTSQFPPCLWPESVTLNMLDSNGAKRTQSAASGLQVDCLVMPESWIPHQVRNDKGRKNGMPAARNTIVRNEANLREGELGVCAAMTRDYVSMPGHESGPNEPNFLWGGSRMPRRRGPGQAPACRAISALSVRPSPCPASWGGYRSWLSRGRLWLPSCRS